MDREVKNFESPSNTSTTNLSDAPSSCLRAKQILHMPNFPSLVLAVKQGKGLALLGYCNEDWFEKDLKFYQMPPLPDPPYMVIAWRTNDVSKEARNFVNMIPEV